MDQNTTDTLNQNVDVLFTNLEDFTQKEGVIGKPVTHENMTFLPIVSVTLGYGGGNSASKSQPGNGGTAGNSIVNIAGKMAGGALGIGAKLNTEAVILIDKDKDNVTLLPVTAAGSQLADKVPQMIMNMTQGKQGGQQSGSSGGTQSGSSGGSSSGGTTGGSSGMTS